MWLVALIIAECAALYYVTLHWFGYVPVALSLFVYYVARYRDGTDYTGDMRWDAFRRLRVWHWLSPVTRDIINVAEYGAEPNVSKMYVLLPGAGDLYVSLVWGIGLHGNALPTRAMSASLLYVVPLAYMCVPGLREVLQWSGAISFQPSGPHSLPLVLQDVVQARRSVALYASITADHYGGHDEGAATLPLSDDMVNFIRERRVYLAPVLVQNEHRRYAVRVPWAGVPWAWRHGRHPFPVLCCYRCFASSKPPLVRLAFGALTCCDPDVYQDGRAIRDLFETRAKRLACTDTGDEAISFK